MKYFICSRGRNSLSYEFLKNLNSLGEDIYTDYETLVNNYDTFYQMVSDNTACGDIVTIAHDNIGKLSQLSYIAPIVDEATLKQLKGKR